MILVATRRAACTVVGVMTRGTWRLVGATILGSAVVACGPGIEPMQSTTMGTANTSLSSSSDAADGSTMIVTSGGTTTAQSTTAQSTTAVDSSGAGESTTGEPGFHTMCEGPLTDSADAWEAAVATASGSHGFAVVQQFAGDVTCFNPDEPPCALRTTMSVFGEVVVARTLEVEQMRGVEPEFCPEPYVETDADVGSHPGGFPVSTMSQIYARCCELATASGGYWAHGTGREYVPGDLIVRFDDDGLLASCSLRDCDFCGCSTATHFEIDELFVGR